MIVKDNDVWERVAETVKPLKGKSRQKVQKASPTLTVKRTKPVVPAPKPLPVPKKAEKSSPPPLKTQRQLSKQKIPVEAKLDLHGYTLAKAQTTVKSFITQSRRKNLRCIEIITGRGNPEKGTGALRRHVPLWLQDDPALAGHILHLQDNPQARGGSFLILLRRDKTRS